MSKYTVHVDEAMTRGFRKLTASQWLALTRVYPKSEGRTRVFDLAEPITVSVVASDGGKPVTRVCRKSWQVLGMIFRPGLVVALRWRSAGLGPHGLHAFNTARFTAAVRKGGLNIVRHWLEHRPQGRTFLRDDLFALLSFLEIRPVFTRKTPKTARPFASKPTAPTKPNGIYYVHSYIGHNAKDLGGKKAPRVRRRKG